MKKKTRKEIEEEVNIRAWKDPVFKEKLKKHPREALEEFGLKVPQHIKIEVHEETSDKWCLVIQKAPANAQNLSESELKKLGGGAIIVGDCKCV
jgi:nitrile hydratase